MCSLDNDVPPLYICTSRDATGGHVTGRRSVNTVFYVCVKLTVSRPVGALPMVMAFLSV